MENIQQYLDRNEQNILNILKEMVHHESPSRNKELTNKFCDYLENIFREIAKVTRIIHHNKQQKVGDELKIEFGEGLDQILVLAHMDTVWEEGEIERRPFEIKDNEVYGPGIFDMKFGMLQMYWILKYFYENKIKLNYKIVFYIDSHEEIGSRQSMDCIIPIAQNSKCIFVLEPSAQGGLKIQRKGIRVYKIKTTGKNAHAGGGHMYGINAIKELAYQIIDIEKMTDYDKGITVNVGYMKGGREVNVIPDHAEAKFEVRYWTEEQGEEIDKYLMSLKPKVEGAEVEISLYRKGSPFERKAWNVKLFEFAKQVGRKMNLDLFEMAVGGISDANRLAHLNVPILDGLGAIGKGAHSKDEMIYKDCIIERTRLLAEIILELSKCNLNFYDIGGINND